MVLLVMLFIVGKLKPADGSLLAGLYCGNRNCYDVLGIDRTTFRKNLLGKTYRRLAAQFHPDKVTHKDKAESTEIFRQITTAYEVLKDDGTREDYDYYLDHPEQRAYNYYQYYRRRVAPKVDARIVILATVLIISAFQFLSATHKHKEAMDFAMKQEKYRNAAKALAKERGVWSENAYRKSKKTRKEYEEQIIRQIIEENVDIRGGYKKPSLCDTLLWKVFTLPYVVLRWFEWQARWVIKYQIRKEKYDMEAKLYLIRKNMGLSENQFAQFTNEDCDNFLRDELWKSVNFKRWKAEKDEELKERQANSGRYKRYRRYMKSQVGNVISFVE